MLLIKVKDLDTLTSLYVYAIYMVLLATLSSNVLYIYEVPYGLLHFTLLQIFHHDRTTVAYLSIFKIDA